MIRKRLGLSTEPQPVFVGGCFALFMLLMHFYVLQIAANGNIIVNFNDPLTLIKAMTGYLYNTKINLALWYLKAILPVMIIAFAVIFGKKNARLMVIPCLTVVFFPLCMIGMTSFSKYYISHIIYAVTAVFYLLTVLKVIKSVKPFIVYCILVCVAIAVLCVLKQPPFTLFDGNVYLSDAIYFVAYHIAAANFARAVPIQEIRRKNYEKN